MGAAEVVVLLVALGGAREPSTRAMTTATQEALDPTAVVLLREVPDVTLASDARAVAIAEAVHADAVAVLTWRDGAHRRAHVHVYTSASGRFIDRDIDFREVDPPDDRGKALGYAVASMVPPPHHEEPAPAAPPAPPAAPPPAPAVVSPPPRPSLPPPPPPVATAPTAPSDRRLAIDLGGIVSTGVNGYGGGFGSAGGVRWRFAGPVSLRVGAGLRIGDVPPAGATSFTARFDVGLALRAVTIGEARPVSLGFRLDGAALLELLSRPTVLGDTSSGARWLPAGDAMAEVAWTFVPQAAVALAGGAEVAASTTDVFVGDRVVATIPRVRILGEFGLRALF